MPSYETTEDQADELVLYADNDEPLYRRMYIPILSALLRFKARGTYEHERAVKAFQNFADVAAKSYVREMRTMEPWYREFTPAARKLAAREWTKRFEAEYGRGELGWVAAVHEPPPRRGRPRYS